MEEIFTKRRGFVTKKEEDIVRNILQKHAKEQKGEIIGSEYEIIAYYDNGKNLIAAIIFRNVWNALDIKYLAVVKEYRGKKLGEKLLNEALKIAKDELKCKIAYISTFNYQALEYYKQYGFKLEFTRDGYSNDVKYHYLSKILTPSSI